MDSSYLRNVPVTRPVFSKRMRKNELLEHIKNKEQRNRKEWENALLEQFDNTADKLVQIDSAFPGLKQEKPQWFEGGMPPPQFINIDPLDLPYQHDSEDDSDKLSAIFDPGQTEKDKALVSEVKGYLRTPHMKGSGNFKKLQKALAPYHKEQRLKLLYEQGEPGQYRDDKNSIAIDPELLANSYGLNQSKDKSTLGVIEKMDPGVTLAHELKHDLDRYSSEPLYEKKYTDNLRGYDNSAEKLAIGDPYKPEEMTENAIRADLNMGRRLGHWGGVNLNLDALPEEHKKELFKRAIQHGVSIPGIDENTQAQVFEDLYKANFRSDANSSKYKDLIYRLFEDYNSEHEEKSNLAGQRLKNLLSDQDRINKYFDLLVDYPPDKTEYNVYHHPTPAYKFFQPTVQRLLIDKPKFSKENPNRYYTQINKETNEETAQSSAKEFKNFFELPSPRNTEMKNRLFPSANNSQLTDTSTMPFLTTGNNLPPPPPPLPPPPPPPPPLLK